jgi:hypothetical protein
MENVLIWIFWAVIIVISLVNSAAKAKKKKEEAERARRSAMPQSYEAEPDMTYAPPVSDGKYTRKSLGEILEELANPQPQRQMPMPAPEFVEGRDYAVSSQEAVYKEGREAERVVYAEGGRLTKNAVAVSDGDKGKRSKIEVVNATDGKAKPKDTHGEDFVNEIFGGEFDLRRAVVEAEILTPKYF